MDRLEERAKTKSVVRLLPLPTGPKNLKRLGRSRVVLDQASRRDCTDLLKSWAGMETKKTY